MTELLTRDATVAALRDIITEKGADYTYERPEGPFPGGACYNKYDGKPSCIVGHLVARLYPEVFETIGSFTGPSNDAISYTLINVERAPIKAETTELVGEIRSLQGYQDDGQSWGEAFKAAFKETL